MIGLSRWCFLGSTQNELSSVVARGTVSVTSPRAAAVRIVRWIARALLFGGAIERSATVVAGRSQHHELDHVAPAIVVVALTLVPAHGMPSQWRPRASLAPKSGRPRRVTVGSSPKARRARKREAGRKRLCDSRYPAMRVSPGRDPLRSAPGARLMAVRKLFTNRAGRPRSPVLEARGTTRCTGQPDRGRSGGTAAQPRPSWRSRPFSYRSSPSRRSSGRWSDSSAISRNSRSSGTSWRSRCSKDARQHAAEVRAPAAEGSAARIRSHPVVLTD